MRFRTLALLAIALLASGTARGGADDWRWISDDEGYQLTLDHCFGCHGVVFTGARAPNMLAGSWNHMRSLDDMPVIVREGIPSAGMPAFGDSLSDRQIQSISRFFGALVEEAQRSTEFALAQLDSATHRSALHDFVTEPVVDGLRTPWSFAFLPDGRMLIAERVGALRFVQNGQLSQPVADTPQVWERQDGGLLALAIDPDYARNGWVYLSFSDAGPTFPTSMLRIVRGRVREHAWVDEEVVWSAPIAWYSDSNMHYGTRLLMADGYLYFSVGDRGDRTSPQDLASPFGKIHRIFPDGRIPDDNPFVKEPGDFASIWSYGHRNVQGLARSRQGELWASEHGPKGGDELNRIGRGLNYGWPLATGGTEYNGDAISEFRSLPGMEDPVVYWGPEMAPSAILFCDTERFPRWIGQLLVGSLASQELRRVELLDGRVVDQEVLLQGLGRIRDIETGPDGMIYLALERYGDRGGIVRIKPAR